MLLCDTVMGFPMNKRVRSIATLLTLALGVVLSSAQTPAKVSTAETKKLDVFFSNFAETWLHAYHAGHAQDKMLLEFAISHYLLNTLHPETSNGLGLISPGEVDRICLTYFGAKPKKHPVTSVTFPYESGKYRFPISSGEMYRFARVASVTAAPGGRYKCVVRQYSASSGWTGDVHGSVKAMDKNQDLTPCETVRAVITKAPNGHYTLLDWVPAKK